MQWTEQSTVMSMHCQPAQFLITKPVPSLFLCTVGRTCEFISAIILYDYCAMISKDCPSKAKDLFYSLSNFELEDFANHAVDFTSFELTSCISTGSSLSTSCT